MKCITHIHASVSIHVSIYVRPNRAALKETVDSEQDYFRMRQDGGPDPEGWAEKPTGLHHHLWG